MTASGVAEPTPRGPVAVRVIGVGPRKNANPAGRAHLGACAPPAEDPGKQRNRPQRGQRGRFALGTEAVRTPPKSDVGGGLLLPADLERPLTGRTSKAP